MEDGGTKGDNIWAGVSGGELDILLRHKGGSGSEWYGEEEMRSVEVRVFVRSVVLWKPGSYWRGLGGGEGRWFRR